MKKKIKVKFLDFYPSYSPDLFLGILSKRYEVEISDDPDFLICSVYDNKHFYYDCVKIFWTGENITPNFNVYDYSIGFDYIDFEDRYLRLPLWQIYADFSPRFVPCEIKSTTDAQKLGRKFCNFIYSNSWSKKRVEFFNMLSKYKRVDSGGRFMNNVGAPCESKLDFQKNYKFSIAFENFESNGYTTEKLTDAFAAGTVPIYWGNPRVAEEFNPEAFINFYEYGTLESVMSKVLELDRNDAAYLKMLAQPIFKDGYFARGEALLRLESFLYSIIERGANAKRLKHKMYWTNEKYSKNIWRIKRFFHRKLNFKIDYK